jgi:uncharacterized protein (TIGR02145 family)
MTSSDPVAAGVSLTVTNPATGMPVLYLGQAATLDVRLVNATGMDIALSVNAPASFAIFLPQYFSPTDAQGVEVDLAALPDWSSAPPDGSGSIQLTKTGADAVWAAGEALSFSLRNVRSSAQQSGSDSLQVNPAGIAGVPLQIAAPLSIIAAPAPGNAKLSEGLQLSLDHQGIVYVSRPADPLANTLFLNLKNTAGGPLYSGTAPSTSTPQIHVSFVYGSTVGALAPADATTAPLGSAWNIVAAVHDDGGNPWTANNPSLTSGDAVPTWTLAPATTNAQLIGVGDHANLTFSFGAIVSFLLPGHTQMMIRFSGFAKDETTMYDEEVFVLDIVKEIAPSTRGLLGLFSVTPLVHVSSPTDQVSVPLRWSMAQVAKVSVINSVATSTPVTDRSYLSPPPALAYDQMDVAMTGFLRTTPVFLTVQAFDGMGAYLNSLQFITLVQADMFLDPVDGKVYPSVRIGNQLWMAANLDRTGANSYPAQGPEAQFGRLFTLAVAGVSGTAEGWRLPHRGDWDGLVARFGSPAAAYSALIAGGPSGFNAMLGGYRDPSGQYSGYGQATYYWTDTPGTHGGQQYANLSATSSRVNLGFEFTPDFAVSVRYVRDL